MTQALTDFADGAVAAAISHLLLDAAAKGEIVLADPYFPEQDCGFVALAMGKHGARELNYSSDVDLIMLYEPTRVDYRGTRSLQELFVRMTQALVNILQQRTPDGYVCRVDLRLRPGGAATPVAMSLSCSGTRAAMIAASLAVAGSRESIGTDAVAWLFCLAGLPGILGTPSAVGMRGSSGRKTGSAKTAIVPLRGLRDRAV